MANQKRFLLLLFASITCLLAVETAGGAELTSHKHRLSILLNSPAGWNGPAYTPWPSYETWSFGKGKESAAAYIEIRVDPVREPELDWNTATKEQVKKTFDDFSNPEVEVVSKIAIHQRSVVVWAAHNVDGELLIAKLRRDGCDLNFSLRTNSRAELRRYQKTFLDVLTSVRFK